MAATAIAVIIGLMFALLAFSLTPPQPVVLLLGILVAVVGHWAVRVYWVVTRKRTPD